MISNASLQVVSSGKVGPLAITLGSSPGTSEMTKVTTLAGEENCAKRPPLIFERCFLTQLISEIDAPQDSNCLLTSFFSSRLIPSAGTVNKADPPPEIKQTTKSSADKPLTLWII